MPKAILIVESWPIWNLSTMLQNTAKPVPIYRALRNCVISLGPHPHARGGQSRFHQLADGYDPAAGRRPLDRNQRRG